MCITMQIDQFNELRHIKDNERQYHFLKTTLFITKFTLMELERLYLSSSLLFILFAMLFICINQGHMLRTLGLTRNNRINYCGLSIPGINQDYEYIYTQI